MSLTSVIPNEEIVDRMIHASANIKRSKMQQEAKSFSIALELLRIWDAYQTNLPTAAVSDDLGLIIGTLGTDAVVVQTSDSKATTVTQKARFRIVVPHNYVAGEALTLVAFVGMKTTVSDGTATIDFSAYKKDTATGLVGADIVATAAQSINALSPASKTFSLTPTGIVAGDELDVLVTIAITDGATATAVIGRIMLLTFQFDIKG